MYWISKKTPKIKVKKRKWTMINKIHHMMSPTQIKL